MPKTQSERPPQTAATPPAGEGPEGVAPLSHNVRRHLGQTLRGHYADSLAAPVSERLEALIAQLDKPNG